MTDNTWIQTYTGKKFYPLRPTPDMIDIEDIAKGLSHQCRFAGQLFRHYSVCQHSVHVSSLCPEEDSLWGLLHDASEAYLVDVPKPLKDLPELAGYRKIEARLMAVICDKFGLPVEMPSAVHEADMRVLVAEAQDLKSPLQEGWAAFLGAYKRPWFTIQPWTPDEAMDAFLDLFHTLMRNRSEALALSVLEAV